MTFFQVYLLALVVFFSMITIIYLISIRIKNVSIVDLFWSLTIVEALKMHKTLK